VILYRHTYHLLHELRGVWGWCQGVNVRKSKNLAFLAKPWRLGGETYSEVKEL
jgi:hypothetical protein